MQLWFPVLSRSGIIPPLRNIRLWWLWFPVLSRSGIMLEIDAIVLYWLWFPVLSRSGIIAFMVKIKRVTLWFPVLSRSGIIDRAGNMQQAKNLLFFGAKSWGNAEKTVRFLIGKSYRFFIKTT